MHPQVKGKIMNAKSTRRKLKAAAVIAGLVTVLLLPTSACTTAMGGTGGGTGVTIGGL
jgi:hypothetical protein